MRDVASLGFRIPSGWRSRAGLQFESVSEEHVRRLSVRGIASRAIRSLPGGRWSDCPIAFLEFVIRHGRFPRLRNPVSLQ